MVENQKKWGSKFYDVAALFGMSEPFLPSCMLKSGYKDEVNLRSQVFASEEWYSLMDEMKSNRQQGKPLVVRRKLKVIPNAKAGVFDEREVDMIFCFNGQVDDFERRWGENNGKKKLDLSADFPCISTMKCDYSIDDVNKLAHLSSFQLVDGLRQVGFDVGDVGM